MKIFCSKTKEEAGLKAAKSFAEVLKNKPEAVLGLATGSSPEPMYLSLAKMYESKEISFAKAKSVNLDEYVGLAPDHDQSYAYFMRKHLFDKIDIDLENTNLPNGLATDADAECVRYNALFDSFGGTDVQVLGIGLNGHIGFNEPSDEFTKTTNVVKLTESTIKANSRFFESESDVPTMALSMGIGQILRSRKIILLANGKAKAEILEAALFGKVTPRVPASILQFAETVEVYADEDALSVIIEKHGKEAVISD